MRPQGCEPDLLARHGVDALPRPDGDGRRLTGWSKGRGLRGPSTGWTAGGFCAALPSSVHPSLSIIHPSATNLTAAGLETPRRRRRGSSLDELLRSRPVSARWRSSLMGRLDALWHPSTALAVDRLAAAAYPIAEFRWYKATPLDAAVTAPRRGKHRRRRQAGTHRRQDAPFPTACGGCARGRSPERCSSSCRTPMRLRHVPKVCWTASPFAGLPRR